MGGISKRKYEMNSLTTARGLNLVVITLANDQLDAQTFFNTFIIIYTNCL
jgi:hypothetical protein